MSKTIKLVIACLLVSCSFVANAVKHTVTFEDVIDGSSSYSFDGNNDGLVEAVFSTLDTSGFNSFGPGGRQFFVQEPGLVGRDDTLGLRVDFINGAVKNIGFGFAVIEKFPGIIQVFNDNDEQIMAQVFIGDLFDLNTGIPAERVSGSFDDNISVFPEGFVNLSFDGTAAYATIDFNNSLTGADAYIIDNFTFNEVPEPNTLLLFFLGLLGLCAMHKHRAY